MNWKQQYLIPRQSHRGQTYRNSLIASRKVRQSLSSSRFFSIVAYRIIPSPPPFLWHRPTFSAYRPFILPLPLQILHYPARHLLIPTKYTTTKAPSHASTPMTPPAGSAVPRAPTGLSSCCGTSWRSARALACASECSWPAR